LAPKGLALTIAQYRWLVGPTEVASEWFRSDLEEGIIYPVVGCAVVCACAGWATFAPAGKHSFALSLALISLVTLVLLFAIPWMGLTPRRFKGMDLPVFYPSELMAMIVPPGLAAAVLTLIRIRSAPVHIS
jgi:hypothetical protein